MRAALLLLLAVACVPAEPRLDFQPIGSTPPVAAGDTATICALTSSGGRVAVASRVFRLRQDARALHIDRYEDAAVLCAPLLRWRGLDPDTVPVVPLDWWYGPVETTRVA